MIIKKLPQMFRMFVHLHPIALWKWKYLFQFESFSLFNISFWTTHVVIQKLIILQNTLYISSVRGSTPLQQHRSSSLRFDRCPLPTISVSALSIVSQPLQGGAMTFSFFLSFFRKQTYLFISSAFSCMLWVMTPAAGPQPWVTPARSDTVQRRSRMPR